MKDDVSVNVRFPKELHSRIKKAADEDTRSLNGEILTLLNEALSHRESSSD